MPDKSSKVGVIGAGISGLTCARRLQEAGWKVRLFDKGRQVGGRCATRRIDSIGSFDHGAQYFTARHPEMKRHVESWTEAGIIAIWQGLIGKLEGCHWIPTRSETTRYVGVPAMNAFPTHLAQGLDVQLQTRISSIRNHSHQWQLTTDKEIIDERFDFLVITAPAPQSAILTSEFPQVSTRLRTAGILPCWAVMVAFEERLDIPWDAAFVEDSKLSWIARNSSKPGRRDRPDCWVLHANPEWSQTHIERTADEIRRELVAEFWRLTGKAAQSVSFASAHRWRYSIPSQTLESQFLLDRQRNLGLCGDWCDGPRIEGAFLSGLAMADAIIANYSTNQDVIC
jgi:predicted NAD/FAD-dependent oxidoreductase